VYLAASSGRSTFIIFPALSFRFQLIFFNTWVLGIPFFCYYTYELFPTFFSKRVAQFAAWMVLPFYLFVLSNEPRNYVDYSIYMQGLTLILGPYCIFVVVRAFRAKAEGSAIFLIATLIFVATAVHDVALMSRRFGFDSYTLGSTGMFCFACFQSVLLARRFSRAFVQVESSETEIRNLSNDLRVERDQVLSMNINLESIVDEKTRDIRSIMTHIELGIFAITSDQFRIHKDYSQHLRQIFERDDLSGADARTVLFEGTNIQSDELSQAVEALSASLGEEMVSFEINAHCLPHEIQRKNKDGLVKTLEVNWNPIANEDDIVDKILVTIRDVTELRALAEEALDRKEELQFIGELINVSPEAFRRFIHSCREFIQENRKLLISESIFKNDFEILKILFINLHTMKGAARSLYFKKMTKIFHEVEQYYAFLQQNKNVGWDIQKMKNDLDDVEGIVNRYADINKHKLGRKSGDECDIELSEGKILEIYRGLSKIESSYNENFRATDSAVLRSLKSSIFPHIFTAAEFVLHDVCQCVTALAKDLGKASPALHIECKNLYLTRTGDDLLRRTFVHLLRNSLDHGLEKPEERRSNGKTESGIISVTMKEIAEGVLITYSDDGRGLDIERIRANARKQNLKNSADGLSIQDVAELIFCSGLSTAHEVGDISGRGIGMDAVRQYLVKENCRIELKLLDIDQVTTGYYPFIFQITLPLDLFASVDARGPANAA